MPVLDLDEQEAKVLQDLVNRRLHSCLMTGVEIGRDYSELPIEFFWQGYRASVAVLQRIG